jgi:Flp pilus assembly protein TadG
MAVAGRHRREPDDRGAVTVEAAIGLASFVLVLGLVVSGMTAVIDQIRCVDAAREAARLVARGEPEEARTAAGRIAPADAAVAIDVSGEHIRVAVSSAPFGGLLLGLRVHAQAFAVREPDG